jgi:DNA-binding transcriptional ArsR family regulator
MMGAKTGVMASEALSKSFWSSIPNSLRSRKDVDWNAKAVWIVLADYARTCKQVWISKKTIAEETGLSRPTVTRGLAKLESRGLIERLDRPGRSNVYQVHAIGPTGEPMGVEPGSIRAAHPAQSEPPTRLNLSPDTEQEIQNKDTNKKNTSCSSGSSPGFEAGRRQSLVLFLERTPRPGGLVYGHSQRPGGDLFSERAVRF